MSLIMLIHIIIAFGLYLYTLNHINPVTSIVSICKMRYYILQSTAMIYRWYLTIACFDRFALSSTNVRLRNFAKIQIARRVVIIITIIWIILPIYSLVFYNIRNNTCGIFFNIAASLYHSIFITLTASIFPVLIMNICALLTRRNLALKRERRQRNVLQKRNEEKFQSKRDQQVLIMLFIQMMFYGITILPLMGIYFYSAITIYTNKSSDRLNIEQFITYLVEMINFLFPVCSFYLYTMASHMFRIELKTMLRSLFKCQLLENTIRVGPIIHEMQIRDKPEQLTTSLPIPQSFIIDREKFESKTEAIDHN
jgi:hypothetical protein